MTRKAILVVLSINACLLGGRFWQELEVHAQPVECAVRNGDVNADGLLDVTDAINLLGFLFLGDPGQLVPTCEAQVVGLTPEQSDILGHLSLVDLPDGAGGTARTIRITGVNVQIVNGEATTATTNATGNLIVGYQETRDGSRSDRRTGSHNVVVGSRHEYTGYGGLVLGELNTISGPYAAVTGGRLNTASALASSVSGGQGNLASGVGSSVSGGGGDAPGRGNRAIGPYCSVSGGASNTAGDLGDPIDGEGASVSGGRNNRARGPWSTISGGGGEEAAGDDGFAGSGVPGIDEFIGAGGVATGRYSAVTGGTGGVASGSWATVSGGRDNGATARWASISGGDSNVASGAASWVGGGRRNRAVEAVSSVTGGCETLASSSCQNAP